jgi:HEAT repeat protein
VTGVLDRVRALAYDRDRRVRMAAVYAAALLGDQPRLDELGVALREGSEPTRWMAAEFLAGISGHRASELLAQGLEAPQGAVRTRSAMGLGRKGQAGAAIVDALAERAADVDTRVRIAAARALGRIGTAESARSLEAFVRDREPGVRLAACLALAAVSRREGVPVAAKALVDSRREVRRAALAALGELSGQRFGLTPDRAPSEEELESAVRRAQIWWNEHEREYEPDAGLRLPDARPSGAP